MYKLAFLFLFASLTYGCGDASPGTGAGVDTVTDRIPDNDATTDSWTDLFNGTDLTGWHTYGQDTVGQAWKVENGELYLDVTDKDGWQSNNGGDIVTDETYANYELELEWKIGKCGNSGIVYNVTESKEYQYPWLTGPEFQLLDNTCHPDAKFPNHRAGDLYDMIAVSKETVRPAGEWNQAKLVVRDGQVEHWLNGEMVVSYTNKGDEWARMIADSKFKEYGDFGGTTGGQDQPAGPR